MIEKTIRTTKRCNLHEPGEYRGEHMKCPWCLEPHADRTVGRAVTRVDAIAPPIAQAAKLLGMETAVLSRAILCGTLHPPAGAVIVPEYVKPFYDAAAQQVAEAMKPAAEVPVLYEDGTIVNVGDAITHKHIVGSWFIVTEIGPGSLGKDHPVLTVVNGTDGSTLTERFIPNFCTRISDPAELAKTFRKGDVLVIDGRRYPVVDIVNEPRTRLVHHSTGHLLQYVVEYLATGRARIERRELLQQRGLPLKQKLAQRRK